MCSSRCSAARRSWPSVGSATSTPASVSARASTSSTFSNVSRRSIRERGLPHDLETQHGNFGTDESFRQARLTAYHAALVVSRLWRAGRVARDLGVDPGNGAARPHDLRLRHRLVHGIFPPY